MKKLLTKLNNKIKYIKYQLQYVIMRYKKHPIWHELKMISFDKYKNLIMPNVKDDKINLI